MELENDEMVPYLPFEVGQRVVVQRELIEILEDRGDHKDVVAYAVTAGFEASRHLAILVHAPALYDALTDLANSVANYLATPRLARQDAGLRAVEAACRATINRATKELP